MNRFVLPVAASAVTTLVALTVLAATPAAPTRSAVETRSTYDPFAMSRAAQAQPGSAEYENYQHRQAIAKWLKDCDHKVKPPKPRPKRSPAKPPKDDDDDDDHGHGDDDHGHGDDDHGNGH